MSNLTPDERKQLAALLRKARAGVKTGRKPFGETPEERAALARMQEMRDKGLTLKQLACLMEAEKFKTKSGKPWTAAIVNKLLSKKKGGAKR
jgi:hypothetical protein